MTNHCDKSNKLPLRLTVNREGLFTVTRGQATEFQCGSNGRTHYKYRVAIEATNKHLQEPELFVIENSLIDQYFQELYGNSATPVDSCEAMACRAVEHFHSLFSDEQSGLLGVEVTRIYVALHGSEFAFIEAAWEKGKK